MSKEDNKLLKYNYGGKPLKVPFIIYADLESLLEKISICHNNPKKSSTTKINKHTSSCYSLSTHYLLGLIVIEVKTLCKTFLNTEKDMQQK